MICSIKGVSDIHLCMQLTVVDFCSKFLKYISHATVILNTDTVIEFSPNYTKLAMLAFLHCFVVKSKMFTPSKD